MFNATFKNISVISWWVIVLCNSCSVLLCVLEQPRVYNSSAGSFRRDALFGEIDPIGLRPALHPNNSKHRIKNNRETLLHQKKIKGMTRRKQ